MKNKKWLGLGIFVIAILAFVLIWQGTRTQPAAGSKAYTVTVTHKDGSVKNFSYTSDEDYLGDALLEEGLIEGSEDAYGLFVTKVDGEEADYNTDGSWWMLLVDDEMSQTGVSETPLEDGESYGWVYTIN
jgi:hypothetical protein